MEFTKTQIAGLVLGYLRDEKCFEAVDEFVKASPYLKDYKSRGKYFVTRVADLCLIDFLKEYANIYSIVAGRLEATNFYNEERKGVTLTERLLYLLDREENVIINSTPFSEVRTSPAHTLPTNNCSEESDASTPTTPKRKITRTSRSANNMKNADKEEVFDVSEVLTQTLLENHELHEKIAETINIVRNTPEVSKTVNEEHISAGASRELDAIIKTVVQRTEEDPIYNKLIDEIIGTAPFDNQPVKKQAPPLSNTPPCSDVEDVSKPKQTTISDPLESQSISSDTIDDHNNDAVRSIIEVAQNPPQHPPPTTTKDNGEVYVFDGTLDTYLKSSVCPPAVPPNPVYINTGGLIVMPPETTSKQFYIVNNQPLINMNVSTVKGMITDTDIMSMPTIIVNDETSTNLNSNFPAKTASSVKRTQKKIAPKIEPRKKSKTTKGAELINSIPTMSSEPSTVVVTASQTTPSVITVPTTSTRPTANHVRNLDFSTPQTVKAPPTSVWDADLRSLVCPAKSPVFKRKRPPPTVGRVKNSAKKAAVKKNEEEESGKTEETTVDEELKKVEESKKVEELKKVEESKKVEEELKKVEEKEKAALSTPVKEQVPKTPGGAVIAPSNSMQYTPFSDVLEEHLKGVDLMSMPTPKIPITPGFALNLTPVAELPNYNNRSTDYSTSSSYYQPSPTEQNKSVEQLIEECRQMENKSPPPHPPPTPIPNLKIISDLVIKEAHVSSSSSSSSVSSTSHQTKTLTVEKKKCDEHLKKFNHTVIGKKNLNLLKKASSSSSSSSSDTDSSSDSESEKSDNKTIVSKESVVEKSVNNNAKKKKEVTSTINEIISTIEAKPVLDEETRKKNLLTHLEEVRQRTINKIKNPPPEPKVKKVRKTPVSKTKNSAKTPVVAEAKKQRKKPTGRKKQEEENAATDEEAQKLVKGLAQRGIHLVPNKTPQKNQEKKEMEIEDAVKETGEVKQAEEVKKVEDDEDAIVFDSKVCEEYDLVWVHEERSSRRKNVKIYDLEVLKKGFEAQVFAEHLKEEVTRTIRCSSFTTLLDMPAASKAAVSPNKRNRKSNEEVEDELMDYSLVGSVREESPDARLPPVKTGGKKRKMRMSEDGNQKTEKKSKTYEPEITLLKKIDVDSFLDKVHGE